MDVLTKKPFTDRIKEAVPIIIPPLREDKWQPHHFAGAKYGIALFCNEMLLRYTPNLAPSLAEWVAKPRKEKTLDLIDIVASYERVCKSYQWYDRADPQLLISTMIEDFDAPFWYIKGKPRLIHADPFQEWKRN